MAKKKEPPKFTEQELLLKSWRLDAPKFVEECVGINKHNGFKISNQQREGLEKLSELARCKNVVSSFNEGRLKRTPTEHEYDYAAKLGISIMSGKGTGKDAFAAWAMKWMLCTFDSPKILCTAPTQNQLKQVLWSEFALWHGRRNRDGEPMFLMKSNIAVEGDKIYMRGVADVGEKDGKYWSAFYRTPQRNVDKAQMQKTLSGFHADNMMFVLDEASGIDDFVFEDLENTMSGRVNFSLLIFNPHKPSGFAFDTHYGKYRDQWIQLHWDAEESDNVTSQHILSMERKYGRESDNFLVNVKGLPPRGGDDSLIPYQMAYEAYNREVIPPYETDVVVGIDVARGGKDYTVITVLNHAGHLVYFDRFNQLDYTFQKARIVNTARRYSAQVLMDVTGVGDPIYDDLVHKIRVVPYRFTNESKQKLIINLSIGIEKKSVTFPHETDLITELEKFGYQLTPHGNITYGAASGFHDDCVISLALAFWQLSHRWSIKHRGSEASRVIY